ncbi:hypothetical protein [Mycobacterium riyadhense]
MTVPVSITVVAVPAYSVLAIARPPIRRRHPRPGLPPTRPLDGVTLDEPSANDQSVLTQAIAAIEAAPAASSSFGTPFDRAVLLFGIGLAWAHSPAPEAATDDPTPSRTPRRRRRSRPPASSLSGADPASVDRLIG